MPVEYDDAESYPTSRPPIESGTYGVLRTNGVTGEGIWDGASWIENADVVCYSGRPMKLSKTEREQHRRNIRAGMEVPEGVGQRTIAQRSAIALARHSAVRLERATSDDAVTSRIKSMFGYFTVARNLGVSFEVGNNNTEATLTDKKLLEWAVQQLRQIDPSFFARVEALVGSHDKMRDWLDDLLDD